MANGIFNVAKGRFIEFANNVDIGSPTNSAIIVVALQDNASFPTDDALGDFDTLSAVLADANIAECDFTNYARDTLVAADVTLTLDDTDNEYELDIPDIVYTDAGNGTNNTIRKILLCYDADTTGGDDTNIIPMAHYDAPTTPTTDGSTLTFTIPTDGIAAAT